MHILAQPHSSTKQPETTRVVSVCGVLKLFGPVRALAQTNLEINSGEVIAVMGPNGAGKSTLLSILALAARPTRGTIKFNGKVIKPTDASARATIGLVSHNPMLYPEMTGEQNLHFFASLYQIPLSSKLEQLRENLGLTNFFSDRPVGVLSRGQVKRIALARALLSNPTVLLLDEPATGLDRSSVRRIEQVLKHHREQGRIAVVITHEIELASLVATRAIIMKNGQVVKDTEAPSSPDLWRSLYIDATEDNAHPADEEKKQ